MYDCIVYVFLPEWVAIIARCLFSDGVFEDLASVDFLFDTSASDESIHDHVLLLSDAEGSIYSLSVRRWVPTRINCIQQKSYCCIILKGQADKIYNSQDVVLYRGALR